MQVLAQPDDPFLSCVGRLQPFRSQHEPELREPLFAPSGDSAGQPFIALPVFASLPAAGNDSSAATGRQQKARLQLWGWVLLDRDLARLLAWESCHPSRRSD